jgi:arsenate reductase
MAVAWAHRLAGDVMTAKSAGIDVEQINEMTVSVMLEVDIDMSGETPTKVNPALLEWADIIVTLCDYVEEQCPIVNAEAMKLHFPLSSPAKLKGSGDAILAAFRQTRDKVKSRVEYVLTLLPVQGL